MNFSQLAFSRIFKPGPAQGLFLLKGSFSLPLFLPGCPGCRVSTSVKHLVKIFVVNGAIIHKAELNQTVVWLHIWQQNILSQNDTHPGEGEDRLADRFAWFCVVSLVWRLWVGIRLQPSHYIPFDLRETL